MAVDIGPKIGIEGESEFRKQIKNVNEQIKTLGTEMKVVEETFRGQEDATEALTAKSRVLREEIVKQAEKLDLLTKGLQESIEKYGETDERTLKWQQSVNTATAQLAKMQNELDATTKDLEEEGAEADKAGKATKEAGEDAKDSSFNWKALGDTVKVVGEAMAAAAAAAAAAIAGTAKALTDFAVGGAEFADNILTMASTTGMSAEKLQELEYAADLVDVSVDTISSSMTKNLSTMVKAANGNEDLLETYNKLGVAVTDANGNLRDDEEVYWELIDALGNVDDETERDVLAMQLLGKSAKDLNPLIETGADGMKDLAKQAHQAGYVLDKDTLDAFGEFDDQLIKLDKGAQAAKNALGTVLLPMLTDLAGDGVDLLGEFSRGVLDANGDISQIGEVIAQILPQVIDRVLSYLPELVEMASTILTAIVSALLDNMDLIVESASTLVQSLLDGILNNLDLIIDGAVDVILALVKGLIDNLPKVVEAGIELIVSVCEGIGEALPELVPAAVDAVITIVEALLDNIDLLIDASIKLIIGLAEGLIKALPRLLAKGPEIVGKLATAIIGAVGSLLKAAGEMIAAIGRGIAEGFRSLIQWGRDIIDNVWQGIKEKISDATQWGKDLIQNFKDGMSNRWENLKTGVREIGQGIKNYLGFSEPKEGPLSDFHTYAPDMIDLFIKGLKENTGRLQEQLAKTFDPAGMTAGVADITVGGAGGMAVTIPLSIDGQKLTEVIAQIQWQQGTAAVRNYGNALA